ncbi:cell wall metabolism sensor histidine kinase WalK [Sediminibacillus massiliensis]|uniref:cell wall metabolism sensor histidine kinase WalK n=1 Tax=Sediminibacillus massiliensis TaxID=1926277 RepID=UPI0009887E44|nr:cell wall metabolism sensor histidine kinase WalK [Sediminibacillus massiliensis]
MKKVGFFQSIRLKFIIIYILLLLLAIQVIGAYFAENLEEELLGNFRESVDERVRLLTYNLEEQFAKERPEDGSGPTLQDDIQQLLYDFDSEEITNIQIIDEQSRIIGTSQLDRSQLGRLVTGDSRITRALIYGRSDSTIMLNRNTENRTLVRVFPIENGGEPVGAVKMEASIEEVYDQLKEINRIFANGTILAITISALLGILVARTITKPITEMRKQAKIMSTGDFSQKVNVYGGDEIGQLATTFNDMNDKLRLAHLTTEGERRKLSSVLSNMSDGVLAADKDGTVTLINEPAARLLNKTFEEVKGQQLIEVLNLEERGADLSEFQETGSLIIDFSDEEEFFLIKANFSVVLDESEQVTGFITVISDVTEQEKVERERREFVSNVSHELRTPLTTMRSYIEALTDGAWKDEEIAPRFLDVTQNETDRMIRLVNDLLQLSRMDHKESNLYKEKVNFVSFFHQIIDRFEMNKSEDIILERKLPNEDIFVWLDKDKMTQVIDNIISNAIKYSPEGGKIKFGLSKERMRIKVSISDEGMGIAPEKLDKIFERFYRADKARSRKLGGTGLGLAIAKEIVESHQGHIWAESKEGKGTTVLFTLPLMKKKRGNAK